MEVPTGSSYLEPNAREEGRGVNGTRQLEPNKCDKGGSIKTQEEGRNSQWVHWKADLPSGRREVGGST